LNEEENELQNNVKEICQQALDKNVFLNDSTKFVAKTISESTNLKEIKPLIENNLPELPSDLQTAIRKMFDLMAAT
jgi:hypothetical protein